MKYIFVNVPIPIEEGSELHSRLLALAEKMGVDIEKALGIVATLGINPHIQKNLCQYERFYQQK